MRPSMLRLVSILGFAALFVPACASSRPAGQLSTEQDAFWISLRSLCGGAFEGRITQDTTSSPDFAGKRLVMHVRQCEDGRILVPFHVGDDRSRTWVFTRTRDGLRLKHDHRHSDGSEDDLTQYGGDTLNAGTSSVQEFHADAHTARMLPAAATRRCGCGDWLTGHQSGSRYAATRAR